MLSTELKSQIQGAYSQFLEAKGLKPRYGQRLMIAEVAKVLGTIKVDDEGRREGEPAVVAVEAGTGTGKTVAYSLAAIPAALRTGEPAPARGRSGLALVLAAIVLGVGAVLGQMQRASAEGEAVLAEKVGRPAPWLEAARRAVAVDPVGTLTAE